jgi:hypothetical protein
MLAFFSRQLYHRFTMGAFFPDICFSRSENISPQAKIPHKFILQRKIFCIFSLPFIDIPRKHPEKNVNEKGGLQKT